MANPARPCVYLAGPEVFLREARELGRAKQALCERHGFEGLHPLDSEIPLPADPGVEEARALFRANVGMIRRSKAVVANLTPFRGPSADPGTVLEVGLAFGLGLPVFAYTHRAEDFEARTRAWLRERGFEASRDDPRDDHGLAIEHFGQVDNLMIDGVIDASGGSFVRREIGDDALYSDLEAFEECLRRALRYFGA